MSKKKFVTINVIALMIVVIQLVLGILNFVDIENYFDEQLRVEVDRYYTNVTAEEISDLVERRGIEAGEKAATIDRLITDRGINDELIKPPLYDIHEKSHAVAIKMQEMIMEDVELDRVDTWTAQVASINIHIDTANAKLSHLYITHITRKIIAITVIDVILIIGIAVSLLIRRRKRVTAAVDVPVSDETKE